MLGEKLVCSGRIRNSFSGLSALRCLLDTSTRSRWRSESEVQGRGQATDKNWGLIGIKSCKWARPGRSGCRWRGGPRTELWGPPVLRCQGEKEERAQGTEQWPVRAEEDPECRLRSQGKEGWLSCIQWCRRVWPDGDQGLAFGFGDKEGMGLSK